MPDNPLYSCSTFSSSNILASSSMLYSSSFSSSSMIGEYIGMESCLDLNVNIEGDNHHDHDHEGGYYNQRRKRDRDQRSMMKKKEFPPPITSLARTENQSSHMPWVLKRYYTNDGRLILREEKVKHHDYFKAHRSNGRLTLQLVLLDKDEDDNVNENEDEDEKEHCINANQENRDNDIEDFDEIDDFVINRLDLGKSISDHENENEHCHDNDGDKKRNGCHKIGISGE